MPGAPPLFSLSVNAHSQTAGEVEAAPSSKGSLPAFLPPLKAALLPSLLLVMHDSRGMHERRGETDRHVGKKTNCSWRRESYWVPDYAATVVSSSQRQNSLRHPFSSQKRLGILGKVAHAHKRNCRVTQQTRRSKKMFSFQPFIITGRREWKN